MTLQLDRRGDALAVEPLDHCRHFSIPDHETRRVRSVATQLREPIIAVFHSHPDGWSELSEFDRMALAYSKWPWVVVTPTARAGDVELRRHDISP